MKHIQEKKERIIFFIYYLIIGLSLFVICYVIKNYLMGLVCCLLVVGSMQSLLSMLEKKDIIHSKIARILVCFVVYIGLFIVISGGSYFLSQRFIMVITWFFNQIEKIDTSNYIVSKLIDYIHINQVSIMNNSIAWIHQFLISLPNLFLNLFFVILTSFLVLFDYYHLKMKLMDLLGKYALQGYFIVETSKRVLGIYLKVHIKIYFCLLVEMLIGFYLFGIKPAFCYAFVFSFFDLLPVIGIELVFLPWIFYLFIQGDLIFAFQLLLLYSVLFFSKQWIETKGMADYCGIPVLYMLIGIYICIRFFGLIGMLIGPFLCIMLYEIYIKGKENG
ncbi:AI-2E family transporter [Tannockella kyphosi]|uniref:AI-2E family transporter n=1 Tax=Tannockella kyphosi TaxID=2899121 RepID=UPI00201115EA|nr:AI-2E family transporter [Tannockella kyphosi]